MALPLNEWSPEAAYRTFFPFRQTTPTLIADPRLLDALVLP
jgi:hypothetical protein